MSDLPEPLPLPLQADDEEEPAPTRRHALWVLVVLGCLAVTVGCLMVLLGGGGGPDHRAVDIMPPVQSPTGTASHSVAGQSAHAGHARSRSPASSVPSAPAARIRHGDPCPDSSACVVAGDGGALAAVNGFRTTHGLAAVVGGVTPNAQECAQSRGSGPTCVPHYAWTSLPDQDGAKAVAKIAGFGGSWLLDNSTSTVSVGWAYVGGQYECVLLKSP